MEVSLATVPCLIRCVCACVLTVQIEPHIYTRILSLLVIEIERARESQSLLVSDSDGICMRNNEMLYDFVNVE